MMSTARAAHSRILSGRRLLRYMPMGDLLGWATPKYRSKCPFRRQEERRLWRTTRARSRGRRPQPSRARPPVRESSPEATEAPVRGAEADPDAEPVPEDADAGAGDCTAAPAAASTTMSPSMLVMGLFLAAPP